MTGRLRKCYFDVILANKIWFEIDFGFWKTVSWDVTDTVSVCVFVFACFQTWSGYTQIYPKKYLDPLQIDEALEESTK